MFGDRWCDDDTGSAALMLAHRPVAVPHAATSASDGCHDAFFERSGLDVCLDILKWFFVKSCLCFRHLCPKSIIHLSEERRVMSIPFAKGFITSAFGRPLGFNGSCKPLPS